MNPYTLTAKKEVDETAERPYQVIITIDFHDDAFYEQLLAFVKQHRKLCIRYSERFQFSVGMKKDRQYTFDMVLRGEKIEETQQTLLDLLVDGTWTYSFHDQRLQEEFFCRRVTNA
ncbi:hypothetical protein [Geomicrobium sp. JCM 19055]|uniref:hypothetical protein n=1 Tax=Geomicrobium sp. JCM 19055 TaxID=1460649 RepID=UPI00045ED009|nr:hypothetical protein [Geomicrobium sp. JCM 19055]GAK01584.1 hypothetical protein JCM19055_4764 [Geomicrobium sp. JCM 19055]